MTTTFKKLNEGWNADPNSPDPRVLIEGTELLLEFSLNDLQYPDYKKAEKGFIRFRNCWRYRLGQTNDEGWHRGQCRFSRLAPKWGEFYEIHGDLLLNAASNKEAFYDAERKMKLDTFSLNWITIGQPEASSRHFLFYFRDETFECDASVWDFSVKWRT
jgi:hypothetical protein